jgi:hypothetical protein
MAYLVCILALNLGQNYRGKIILSRIRGTDSHLPI